MMCSLHVSLHPDHSRDSVATTNQKQPFEFTTARLAVDEPADVRWTLLALAAMSDERELWLEDVDLVSLSLSLFLSSNPGISAFAFPTYLVHLSQ